MRKKLIALILCSISVLSFSTTVSAAISDILVRGKDNVKYQYSFDDLIDSMNGNRKLYDDFRTKGTVIAYYDYKTKRYIDFDSIIDAFNAKENITKFVETADDSNKLIINEPIQTVIINNDGNIGNGEVIQQVDQEAFDVVRIY